jgi:hypothetical protein
VTGTDRRVCVEREIVRGKGNLMKKRPSTRKKSRKSGRPARAERLGTGKNRKRKPSKTVKRIGKNRSLGGAMEQTSYSASEAARLKRISIPTLKEYCKRGLLQFFRTPGGHLRIPADALDRLGQDSPSRSSASGPLTARREGIEMKKLDIEELRLTNEEERLRTDKEKRGADARQVSRAVALRSQAKLEEVKLERQREAEQLQRQQQEREQERWTRRWIQGAVKEFPDWLSEEQARVVRAAVEEALGNWDDGDPENEVGQDLDRVIARVVAPWLAERDTAQRRNRVLEITMWYLKSGATAAEKTTAAQLIRVALDQLPISATELQETTAAQGAIVELNQQIKERVDADAARQRADRESREKKSTEEFNRMMRDQKKEQRVQSGLSHVFWYVTRLQNEEVIEDDEVDLDGLKAAIEPNLREALSGNETTDEVAEFVEEFVDNELELE